MYVLNLGRDIEAICTRPVSGIWMQSLIRPFLRLNRVQSDYHASPYSLPAHVCSPCVHITFLLFIH